VWDIRTAFGATDMLVRTMEQGRDLAATLAGNTCLLMRGHGAVVVGASVQQAVLTAIYLQVNANVLLQALPLGTPEGLSAEEIAKSSAAQFSPLALDRSWEYFCQRAGVEPV
jgi:HCOMODA/2-hydroxy-3-carboxy-muconic semialdehyde decarboxylase